jgi:hypothetical protein
MYEQAIGFARQWGLDEHIQQDRYDELVAPVSV